jgi:hypothetical protein
LIRLGGGQQRRTLSRWLAGLGGGEEKRTLRTTRTARESNLDHSAFGIASNSPYRPTEFMEYSITAAKVATLDQNLWGAVVNRLPASLGTRMVRRFG